MVLGLTNVVTVVKAVDVYWAKDFTDAGGGDAKGD
jgi:hypothetical protein